MTPDPAIWTPAFRDILEDLLALDSSIDKFGKMTKPQLATPRDGSQTIRLRRDPQMLVRQAPPARDTFRILNTGSGEIEGASTLKLDLCL